MNSCAEISQNVYLSTFLSVDDQVIIEDTEEKSSYLYLNFVN